MRGRSSVSAGATKEEPISKIEERKKQSPGGQPRRRCESLQRCALPRTLLLQDLFDRGV